MGILPDGAVNKKTIKPTPFGPIVVQWSTFRGQPRVNGVVLPQPDLSAERRAARISPDAVTETCAEIRAVCADIAAALRGQKVRFPLSIARLDLLPPFQQAVLRADHAIPRGKVSTYGLVAAHLGKPRAARAVGNALSNNPFPIIIPCHRVIRSDGAVGGYRGGPSMKRALLEHEGIGFDDTGRVGVAKSDREIYEMCLRELDVAPGEAVFVGDGGSSELPGARAVGMTAIMVTNVIARLWPDKAEARKADADLVIEHLSELLERTE